MKQWDTETLEGQRGRTVHMGPVTSVLCNITATDETPSVIQFEHQTAGNHEASSHLPQLIVTTSTDRPLCTLASAVSFQCASDLQEMLTRNTTQLIGCVFSILTGNIGVYSLQKI
jgi:hypothetical protein